MDKKTSNEGNQNQSNQEKDHNEEAPKKPPETPKPQSLTQLIRGSKKFESKE